MQQLGPHDDSDHQGLRLKRWVDRIPYGELIQVGKHEHDDGYRVYKTVEDETQYWWPVARGPACLINDGTVRVFTAEDDQLDWEPTNEEPNCTLEWLPCHDGLERMFAVPKRGFTEGVCSVKYGPDYWNDVTKRQREFAGF